MNDFFKTWLQYFKFLNDRCENFLKLFLLFSRSYSNELDTTSDFPAIYRQEPNKLHDEEFLKILMDYKKLDKISKFTVIPGNLKISISAVTEQPQSERNRNLNFCSGSHPILFFPDSLTTTLSPLKPFPIPPSSGPVIEITEFGGTSEKEVHPFASFVNHLYVYPITLNFDTQKTFTRARNIACLIELRDSDSETAAGLKVSVT